MSTKLEALLAKTSEGRAEIDGVLPSRMDCGNGEIARFNGIDKIADGNCKRAVISWNHLPKAVELLRFIVENGYGRLEAGKIQTILAQIEKDCEL